MRVCSFVCKEHERVVAVITGAIHAAGLQGCALNSKLQSLLKICNMWLGFGGGVGVVLCAKVMVAALCCCMVGCGWGERCS